MGVEVIREGKIASRRGRDQRLGRIFPKMPKPAWGGDKWVWRLFRKVASRRG